MKSIIGDYRVIERGQIASGIYSVVFDASEVAYSVKPGQFVHVMCGEGLLLRRPISVCDTDGSLVKLVFEVKGAGTEWLAKRKFGDLLNVMGPLGNGFPTPPLPPLKEGGNAASPLGEGGNAASPPEVGGNAASPLGEGGNAASPLKEGGNAASPPEVGGNAVSPPLRGGAGGERILLVGGGIGTAPLLLAARTLGKSCDALLGFATADKAILLAEFAERCGNAQITSDNGSLGRKGFVTELLSENYSAIFACGPKPMLKAVAELAKIPCYVSMEERMGCGIGACLTCVCKTTRAVSSEQRAESYSRVCKDGPVFSAEDIVWE